MRLRLMPRYRERVGQPPGVPQFTGERQVDSLRLDLIEYDADSFAESSPQSIAELEQCRTVPRVSWVNVIGLHDTDALSEIGRLFDLHPLVVEDIANTDQQPKAELFDNYLLLVLKMIRCNDAKSEIDIEQVSVVLGRNWVITFQEKPGDVFDPLRERLRAAKGRIRATGADYLAYSLLDAVVDHYFLVLESLGERTEDLEDEVLDDPQREVVQRIHQLKRELIVLRRGVWPLREALSLLQRGEHPLIAESTLPYLRDVYDHCIQVIDTIETFRDMVSGLLDVYLSSVSNRMNEVMKVLTIIATIFIPLSFVAGVYGMNFDVMPELHWRWGYYACLGLCALIAGGMMWFFRRKRWI